MLEVPRHVRAIGLPADFALPLGLNLSKNLQGPGGDPGLPNFLCAEPRDHCAPVGWEWEDRQRSLAQRGSRCSAGRKNRSGEGREKGEGLKIARVSTYRSSQKLLPWEAAVNPQLSARLDFGWAVGEGRASPGRSSFWKSWSCDLQRVTAQQGRDNGRGLCV